MGRGEITTLIMGRVISSDIFRIIDEGLHKTGDFITLTVIRNEIAMAINLQLEGNKTNWWKF